MCLLHLLLLQHKLLLWCVALRDLLLPLHHSVPLQSLPLHIGPFIGGLLFLAIWRLRWQAWPIPLLVKAVIHAVKQRRTCWFSQAELGPGSLFSPESALLARRSRSPTFWVLAGFWPRFCRLPQPSQQARWELPSF